MTYSRKGVCSVCAILDNDWTFQNITWCSRCGRFMCGRCRSNPIRRAIAVIKNFLVGEHDNA